MRTPRSKGQKGQKRPHRLARKDADYKGGSQKKPKATRTPGPKPETLTVEGPWRDAVRHAVRRGKPATVGAQGRRRPK